MRLSRRDLLLSAATTLAGGGPAGADTPPAAPPEPAPAMLTARKLRGRLPGSAEDSDILSFDGTPGGPVLRLTQGATLAVRLTNGLDTPLSLQWHGSRASSAVEGNWPLTGEVVAAGAVRDIRFTPPDSGLTWFHPAALPGQPDYTGGGLRGLLIVEEAAPPVVDRDVLLAIAEWRPGGAAGPPPLTVNGKEAPERVALAPGGRLRLRVVNVSTTRAMILGLDGARPLIIAIDGQPCELFEPVRDQVPVGPGARFEFMIDLPPQAGAALRVVIRSGADDRLVFEARTEGAPRAPLPPIAALPRNPRLAPAIPLEKSARADLRMEIIDGPVAGTGVRWRLNARASLDLATAPLLKVKQGASVTLGLDNRSGTIVPLRVHGHVMRLLHAKDDGWEPYWRDSVILLPNSTNHVAFIADNPGKWLIESALFDQAAFGLRSWFEVV